MRGVPSPWEFVLLALAAYRLTRLVGWDDFPPIAQARSWLIGEEWAYDFPMYPVIQDTADIEDIPTVTEPGEGEHRYRRPLLAHLIFCPFCVGFWISLGIYLGWVWGQDWALAVYTPFAVSGVVGLIAKNLD